MKFGKLILVSTWGAVGALVAVPAFSQEACTSDSDCSSYEICNQHEQYVCEENPPGCLEGETDEECAARQNAWEMENCDAVTRNACLPRYMLPCESAEDCGEGFTCPSGACEVIVEDCSADADCPEFWTCPGEDGEVRQCNPPSAMGSGGSTTGSGNGESTSDEAGDADESSTGCSIANWSPAFTPASFAFAMLPLFGALWRRRGSRKNT